MMSGSRGKVLSRRHFLGRLAATGAVLSLPSKAALAQVAYPTHVVRLVTPFSPGGPSDLIGRLLGAELEKVLGQPFIVESRAGAASNIGTASVARAEPDGHTLLIPANNFMINPAIYKNPGYDPLSDFAPITELAASPCVIVAGAKTGIRSIQELIERDHAKPGTLNYSTPGVGSPNHLVFEILSRKAKLTVTHVPYQGGAPAMQAVLAGDTELASTLLPNVMAQRESGALNILAVTGDQRAAEFPEVPTLAELGFGEGSLEIVFMLMAPAKTPSSTISTLVAHCTRIMNTDSVRERLRPAGFRVVARGPAALKQRVEREVALFQELVPQLNIAQR